MKGEFMSLWDGLTTKSNQVCSVACFVREKRRCFSFFVPISRALVHQPIAS